MSSKGSNRTTVGLSQSTKNKLESLKPFNSMSYDEFLSELADQYETDAKSGGTTE